MRNADQDEITALLTAMRAGTSSNIGAAHSLRINDRGALMLSAMGLAVSPVETLAAETSIPTTEWCRRWAQ
jgi:ABC-type enterochelin transport system ATPase subunit